KTPELRPGYLVLNDSSIFLDREGGSLAKSFSVVEGKYNLPDLVANCLKSLRMTINFWFLHRLSCPSPYMLCLAHQLSHNMGLLAELTASLEMLYFVVHLQLLQEQNMLLETRFAIVATLTSHFLPEGFPQRLTLLYCQTMFDY
ncbi:hypothetical protein Tco_0261658, partial [Tanacetum coccineum]